jgi:hypothetical protein
VLRHIPRFAFLASSSGGDIILRVLPVRSRPDTNLRPMSTRLGEKTLAAVSITLDHPATHLDRGCEGLEGRQRHRAAHDLVAPPPERLVQFRGVDAVQPDQLSGHDDGVAVDNLGGRQIGTPPELRNGDEVPEHSATVHCQTSGGAEVGWGYCFVC